MKVVLIGTGGYGLNYVRELLGCKDSDVHWVGVVDPYIDSCELKDKILEANIPVYATIEEFYENNTADLALLSTPTYLHRPQSIYAVSHGSNVLCEKPLAPTVEDAVAMHEAEKKYGRFIAIGYQWSYSKVIQDLKKDILNGVLGTPISLKTIICWPRNYAYFKRGTGWAGKISKDGVMVLDSIAANACAHYLHNMFFVLGKSMNSSILYSSFEGECLRANNIENFDTCSFKIKTVDGVPLYYVASHATDKRKNPEFVYTFENAIVRYSQEEDSIIRATFNNGETKVYGDPFADSFGKIWNCVDCIRNGTTPICTVETAMTHNKFIYDVYKNVKIEQLPHDSIFENENKDGIYVKGLYDKICRAYDEEKLLSEI